MEDFFKNIKNKLSIENVVELVEDGKVIDEDDFKEKIKSDFEKDKTNNFMKVDNVSPKLSEMNIVSEPEDNSKEDDGINDSNIPKSSSTKENPSQQDKSKPKNSDLTFFF